jgi:hypothetical protein
MATVDLAVDQTALDWHGEAASTASMRAVSELLSSSQTRRAATTIGDAFVIQGGAIDGHRTALLSSISIIQSGYPNLTIADDGTVTAPALSAEQAADPIMAIMQQKLVNVATDSTKTLTEHLANIATARSALQLTAALGLTDLDQHGGPGGAMTGTSGLSGDRGTQLGTQVSDAAKNGKPIPDEVLDQLTTDLKATGVPPEQLESYLRGEETTIPASTQAYLQNFMNAAGADGFTQASQQLQQQGPAGEQAARSLANGAVMLSNEKVGTGRGSDGKLLNPGGYEKLPASMQEQISTRMSAGQAPDGNATGAPGAAIDGASSAYVEKQTQFIEALSQAESGNEPGTKMSTELYRQGAHMAWLEQNNALINDDSVPGLDGAVGNTVELAARNPEATTAFLTGEGSPEILGDGYDPKTAVMPLLTYESADPNNPAIAPITDWITENSGAGSPDSELAGKSAHGLTQIISATDTANGINNYEQLLSGTGTGQTGGMTSGTSQEVAEALAPYVGKMVDMGDGASGTRGFSDITPVESVRVFSVLSGDPLSSATFNGAALAESQRMDSAFINNGNTEAGAYANRLEWLVNQGITVDYDQQVAANETAANDKTTKLNQAYTAGQILVGGFGPQQAAVAAISEGGKNFLPTFEPESVPRHAPLTIDGTVYDSTNFSSSEARGYNMIQTLVNDGTIDFHSLPPEFKGADDRLKTYSEYMTATEDIDRYNNLKEINTQLTDNGGLDSELLADYTRRADNGEETTLNNTLRPPASDQQQRLSERLATDEAVTDPNNTWRRT